MTMVSHDMKRLKVLLERYPKPEGVQLAYGTAGFRCSANLLPSVFLRMGCLVALLSEVHVQGQAIGIMCTASHNQEGDNGIKIADVDGGMLRPEWESLAAVLANIDNADQVVHFLSKIMMKNHSRASNRGCVHVGFDSRSHSPFLSNLAVMGATIMGADVINHGLVTTPILHHCVYQANGHCVKAIPKSLGGLASCMASGSSTGVEIYLDIICGSYLALLETSIKNHQDGSIVDSPPRIVVDCACGIGAPFIDKINERLMAYRNRGAVELIAINKIGEGTLNEACGAEFVQKKQLPPTHFSGLQHFPSLQEKELTRTSISEVNRFASLDGDADRIVFHYLRKRKNLKSFGLIDGDKIAALVALFVQNEINILKAFAPNVMRELRCGIVQTAYANGSSTLFLKNVAKIDVKIAKTGVKYVHAAAHDNFDVGIYFEANGHGTVLFSERYYECLDRCKVLFASTNTALPNVQRAEIALKRLEILPVLINQAVGDALSDLLLVEAIMHLRRTDRTNIQSASSHWALDFEVWDKLYTELPSRQLKVKVKDRTMVQTNDDETKTTMPAALQPALNAAMNAQKSHKNMYPRCFVRPSGTEDAVRIYAESSTQAEADALASEAVAVVKQVCNESGTRIELRSSM